MSRKKLIIQDCFVRRILSPGVRDPKANFKQIHLNTFFVNKKYVLYIVYCTTEWTECMEKIKYFILISNTHI